MPTIYNSRNYQSLLATLHHVPSIPLIYNSRNYQSLLALTVTPSPSPDLQQQKLLELTSLDFRSEFPDSIYNSRNYQSLLAVDERFYQAVISTIVEIIRAYQPHTEEIECFPIYNSRNYQSLLAREGYVVPTILLSTIVEIIRAYQPNKNLNNCIYIYNSRNYQSLLAYFSIRSKTSVSTIVEIIRAYQPQILAYLPTRSTIVEIIRAYQPRNIVTVFIILSTIVEIIRAYQPRGTTITPASIYNSRNYQSLLALGSIRATL